MLSFLAAWFTTQAQMLREQGSQKGASTIEWVIITVCLIAVAVGVVLLVTNVIEQRSAGIF